MSAKLVPANAAPIPFFDPAASYADADGIVGGPNADLPTQMVDVLTARDAYAMNARVLETSSQMQRMLIQTIA